MDRWYFSSLAYSRATRLTTSRQTVRTWPVGLRRGSPRPLALAAPLARLRTWIENYLRRRRLLSYQSLDPRFAKDIALSPAEIAAECAQPFWRGRGLARREIVSAGRQ
jgi:uncharacterized protein YjiS (DUF1127 family)